jgi:hypothetical protein
MRRIAFWKWLAMALIVLAITVVVCFHRPPPREFKARGLTKEGWLHRLAAPRPSTRDPLEILDIAKDTRSGGLAVGVALSYESLIKNDFREGSNLLLLRVNSKSSGYLQFYGSTNGNCVLQLSLDDLHEGTNDLQAVLWITDPANKDHYLEILGPEFNYVYSISNRP